MFWDRNEKMMVENASPRTEVWSKAAPLVNVGRDYQPIWPIRLRIIAL
jgi:hypothetical protein